MTRAVGFAVVFLALALAATLAGCKCGGGGGACNENTDCNPGEYCDPATLTCVAIDSGPPPTDSAVPGDSGATFDSGSDAGSDAGPVCTDADGDTFTTCTGDCDDSDPFTYPGAPEVCGDGVTNDCGSTMPPDTG